MYIEPDSKPVFFKNTQDIISSPNVSNIAKSILLYLISQGKDTATKNDIMKNFSNKEKTIQFALKELTNLGVIKYLWDNMYEFKQEFGVHIIDDRESDRYKRWRKYIYERDNKTCQWCGINDLPMFAHHIKSWKNNPELRFETENGILLCQLCHASEHRWLHNNDINELWKKEVLEHNNYACWYEFGKHNVAKYVLRTCNPPRCGIVYYINNAKVYCDLCIEKELISRIQSGIYIGFEEDQEELVSIKNKLIKDKKAIPRIKK